MRFPTPAFKMLSLMLLCLSIRIDELESDHLENESNTQSKPQSHCHHVIKFTRSISIRECTLKMGMILELKSITNCKNQLALCTPVFHSKQSNSTS
ncbi:hypothetical protein M758_9G127900 [Ceratodon purpureus]|uniref:Secreted protein n=1 Tax=Ceratodon purpureus TaxID=3225 RepID=A0A8T0GUL4_CERPU|nr:hypothetical protein KC19_9G113500 [Ceratodon purpureus]KAG0606276.1 hypothetical protein M758_9G127900 [Ceratodon purpureus]